MPRIPQITPQVASTPAAQGRLSVRAGEMGQSIGQGVQNAGQVMGQIALQEKRKAASIAVMSGDTRVHEWINTNLYDPENGALNAKGKNAFGLTDTLLPDFDRTVDEIADSLASEDQKAAFRRMAQARRSEVNRTLQRHISRQREVYDQQETDASLANSLEDISNDPTPDNIVANFNRMEGVIGAWADRNGVSEEVAKARLDGMLSKAHVTAIESMLLHGEHEGAMEYFEANREDISKDDKTIAQSIIRARNAELDASRKHAKSLIANARDRMQDGQMLPANELAVIEDAIGEARDPEIDHDWNELRGVQTFINEFQKLPPTQQRSFIDQELAPAANKDGATRAEALTLKAAESKLSELNAAISQGRALSYAARSGIVSDIGDITTPEGLQRRLSVVGTLEARYGQSVMPFTEEESAALGDSLQAATAQKRVRMLGDLISGLGDRALDGMEQLHKSGYDTYAFVGGMAAEGRMDVARDILLGQDALKADSKLKPPDTDSRLPLEGVRRAYPARTGGAVVSSIEAYYARLSQREGDHSGVYDEDRMIRAIDAVTGGIIEWDSGEHTSAFPAPRGVTNNQFEDFMDSLTPDDLDAMGGVAGISSKVALEQIRNRGRLVAVGDGEFLVTFNSPQDDQPRFLMADNPENPDEPAFVLRFEPRQQSQADKLSRRATKAGSLSAL